MTITSQGLSQDDKDLYAEIQNRPMTDEQAKNLSTTQADIVQKAIDKAVNSEDLKKDIANQVGLRILKDRKFNPNA